MQESFVFDLIGILGVILLVLANGFFVAAEFSLISVRRTRIAELVADGVPSAKSVEEALQNPDRVIAATQLGITIASLGLGWIGEPAIAHLISPLVGLLPDRVQPEFSHSLSAVFAFLVITFLHVVVGELAPKSIALQNPEKTSLVVARPTLWTEILFKPLIWALNGAGNAILKLVGVQPVSGHQLVHSVEELKMLVTASTAGGVVDEDESEMLHAIFNMAELMVRQVMVPRTEMIAVEADTPLAEIIDLVSQTTYTKFPVYEDSLDQVLGIVHVKDLLQAMRGVDCEDCVARDFIREPLFVPETITVSSLLRRFRVQRQHIAIVMDEYGGTAGLVTLEDLLEEIVGEVSDPFDVVTPDFQQLADGSILIDGLTLIEEVNQQLGLSLEDEDYDTIAGFVLGRLGRMPCLNDSIEAEGITIRVEEMDGMRIARLAFMRMDASSQTKKENT